MIINTNTFYKTKGTVNGMATPKGFFYVTEVTADKVKFIITESKTLPEKAGTFTLSRAGFEKVVEN